MTWKDDNSFYEGEWQFGFQHGFGAMNFPSGEVREGMFENNVFVGENVEISQAKSMNKPIAGPHPRSISALNATKTSSFSVNYNNLKLTGNNQQTITRSNFFPSPGLGTSQIGIVDEGPDEAGEGTGNPLETNDNPLATQGQDDEANYA